MIFREFPGFFSSSSEGEKVVDSKRTLSEKLEKTSWTNVAKLKSAAIQKQYFAKDLAVFESTKERTKLYEALKFSPTNICRA